VGHGAVGAEGVGSQKVLRDSRVDEEHLDCAQKHLCMLYDIRYMIRYMIYVYVLFYVFPNALFDMPDV